MTQIFKIQNSDEVGYKGLAVGKKSYIYNSVWKPVEIEIDYTLAIQDRTKYPNKSLPLAARGIAGAIIAGAVGYIVMSAADTKWDIDFDVYLKNGMILEVNATTEKQAKALFDEAMKPDARFKIKQLRAKLEELK